MGQQDKITWNGNSRIFKTYVKGRGKRPAEKVKGRDHINTFQEVCGEECFGGILNPEYIDISFDSREMYEAFLDMAEANEWRCLCLPSTKGGHTYWKKSRNRALKNSAADQKLAVGLVADIHAGSTYIPLKVEGVCRFPPDYDKHPDEDYDEVPPELLPVDTSIKLWKMSDGAGRNDTLYKYILVLQGLRLTQKRIRRVISNANKYVLADPLPRSELDVILRDEAFQKPVFFEGQKFLFDEFARWLVKECRVVRIYDQLHIYKDGVYISGNADIERAMIQEIPSLREAQRKEVIKYMLLIADEMRPADARYIAFNNGILDIIEDQLLPFSPDMAVTNRIPWDYDKDAECDLVDRVFNNIACQDPDIRALLEECIGYCFFRRNELRKAFILTGNKRGGKSTYLDCIKAILGDGNISALDLSEIGDRFNTSMMFGKLANIGDDIGDEFLKGSQVSIFKKVVAGNRIKAEYKGVTPFEYNPYIKLLFSANEIPRMRDRGGAVLDRLIIIPFNAEFDKSDPDYDPFLKYKLIEQEPVQYMIRLGVQGLRRILEGNRGFTKSTQVQQQLDEYNEANNPILGFIKDTDVEVDIINCPTRDVYRRYTVFCNENGFTPVGHGVFTKQLNNLLGTTSSRQVRIDNKRKRIFERESVTATSQ